MMLESALKFERAFSNMEHWNSKYAQELSRGKGCLLVRIGIMHVEVVF